MYKKVELKDGFVGIENDVAKLWKEKDIVKKNFAMNEGKRYFTFYDGPPTANGRPHVGHIETRVMKDIIPRYKVMKGYKVLRKAGWDTHGLPVELEIEKELGISGKQQIEEYGVEKFVKKCKESVFTYVHLWEEMTNKVGFWVDMEKPYVTYHNEYIESVWWALKEMWKKGLLYEGHKVMPYCPRCGTALSSHEVAQGYKDVKDLTCIAKFKVKGEENKYILAWTTTPWTLPSNLALCVNKAYTYADVKVNVGTEEESKYEVYVLAKDLVETVLKDKEYEVLKEYKGTELLGTKYEQLMPFAKVDGKAFEVIHGDYVTLTDGTGIVHIAPAYGEDDSLVAKQNGITFVNLVDKEGKFVPEVEPWAGKFVRDCNEGICKWLEEENKLFSKEKHLHSYPHCWRCDTPLLYYPKESWFVAMSKLRDELVANNNKVNWYPDTIRTGRFGKFLENVIDWGISRDRYWGTPLPVWTCEDEECGHKECIGSIKELKEKAIDCPDDIELHKPYIDSVHLKCPKCGKEMKRAKEVIDCWFDSGSMPFAQWHYPFENKELFEEQFPADFISEAVDQTRGWFYSLIAISTLLFDKAPYKNVIVLGHVLDAQGRKMSKSKGNAVEPMKALAQHGADAIRWYFYENSAPWLPNRFHDAAVQEGQRKFMGTLWNTYAFFVLYANIDKFDVSKYSLEYDKLSVLDKWCLSRLNTLIKTVDEDLNSYKITEAAKALQEFVDELSNWYVRRSRDRFWAKETDQNKINAYMTLYTVLTTVIKLAAPMIPFMTEAIYQNLVLNSEKDAPESVHLCAYPVANEVFIDSELEKTMDLVLKAVVLGRAARNEANIKNRQPIALMYVKAPFELNEFYTKIVEEELNVKKVEFKDNMDEYLNYEIKPQFKVLGPKYGKQMKEIAAALAKVDGQKAKVELEATKTLKLELSSGEITLVPEDLDVKMTQTEGFAAQRDGDVTIAISTVLTDELIEEGFVREIISKVQTMRKENGFEVTDRITIFAQGNEKIAKLMQDNAETIKKITLADELVYDKLDGFTKEWNINGEKVTLGVK